MFVHLGLSVTWWWGVALGLPGVLVAACGQRLPCGTALGWPAPADPLSGRPSARPPEA